MTAESSADTRAGIEAYQRGDYAAALAELENAAKNGDAQAFFNLGIMYADGRALPKDEAKAAIYFREGAEKGSLLAAFNYAQALRKGEGVTLDYIEAAKWYRFAAERGDFRACNELGLLFVEGKGVARDLEEGFAWIYPATHASIQDASAFKNASQLASMMTPAQLERAQLKGREYFQRFMEPNREVVELLKKH
jgi:TPR repeat protein